MRNQQPRLLVVDDDRAILTLVGTGVTCLDVLKALRESSPHCEVVLMSGYTSFDAVVDALKRNMLDGGMPPLLTEAPMPAEMTVPLAEVERDHIVRTLQQVRGNKAVAARLLGISRRAFYRQLERHGLHQRIPMTPRDAGVQATGD